jgi:hypothetical protein
MFDKMKAAVAVRNRNEQRKHKTGTRPRLEFEPNVSDFEYASNVLVIVITK